jgi:hypothetical protein
MSEKVYTIPVLQREDGSFQAIQPDLPNVKANSSGQALTDSPIDAKPRPTRGELPDELTAGYNHAPWGINDMLPYDVKKMVYDVPMAGQAIYRLTQMMFGNGLAYYRNDDLYNGSKISRYYSPKIERFLRVNRINTHFLPAQFIDYRFTMNAFSELIFNNDKTLITNIFHKTAEFCRLSIQDERSLRSEYLLFSPKYAEGWQPKPDQIKRLFLFDFENQASFLRKLLGKKFAWHSKFPTPGSPYYAYAFWLALFRTNGWMNVSRAVPEVVNAMMKNQIILKYHVLIPESYFIVRYPDWQSYTHQEREKLINNVIDTINDSLKGSKNAFTSIATIFKDGELGAAPMGKVEIIAVDDKVKKDAWVPSSNAADAQIVQGLGLHPSQVGLQPEGGKMGAGSGSDQRESFNTGITVNTIDQNILLEPLNWIATYNAQVDPEWDVTFFIDHTYHTTTNKQEDGMQPTETTIEVQN